MRHKWDYSRFGSDPRDMLVFGRRVCVNCGATHKKFQWQNWMRVVGYEWDGDGRSACPGKLNKRASHAKGA